MKLFSTTVVAFASLSLPLCSVVTAQGLRLDKFGGGLPGVTNFELEGTPGEEYLLLFALSENTFTIPGLGLTLDIPTTSLGSSFGIPGFFGVHDANGMASAMLAFPNAPIFEQITLSMQAIGGSGPFVASNLIRLTPQVVGTFKPTLEDPPLPIAAGGAVAGSDGTMIFVGGTGPVALRYASRTEEWEPAGASFGVGLLSQTTPLPDGRVLFTGGLDITTGQPTDAAAVYDPASGQTTTLTMGSVRAGHGASVTGDGRVLISGGLTVLSLTDVLGTLNSALPSTEYFDPATDTFSPGPNMLEARALHTSTTLTNGDLLVAGGLSILPFINVPTVSATAYVFDSSAGRFGLPQLMNAPRFLHSAAALTDGKVLVAGGLSVDLSAFLASGNIMDLIVGTRDDVESFQLGGLFGGGGFTAVAGMQEGRAGAGMATLPNGEALIVGGFRATIDVTNQVFDFGLTASADRFSQSPNAIAPTGSMAAPRLFPITVPLPDGTTMIVGGGPLQAEIYQH